MNAEDAPITRKGDSIVPPVEPPRSRNTDPDTSHAAERANKEQVAALRLTVLRTLQSAVDGLTTHEIADRCGVEWGSITPRMGPLDVDGLVIRSELRRAPPGRKVKSIVWYITGRGVYYANGGK